MHPEEKPKVVAIIPARYGSTRFPAKVLADIAGQPMVQWVYEAAKKATLVDEVMVATDDPRVQKAVEAFGGDVIMTSPAHQSGTDRLAEAAEKLTGDLIVNVQGDEPLIHPETIDIAVRPMLEDEELSMSSAKVPIGIYDDYVNPNAVKVVCDDQDVACYFSRSPIPYYREGQGLLEQWRKTGKRPEALLPIPMKHIGIYVYKADFLAALTLLPVSALEKAERLEQLRVLTWGIKIKVPTTPHDSIGVDTPEDAQAAAKILQCGR